MYRIPPLYEAWAVLLFIIILTLHLLLPAKNAYSPTESSHKAVSTGDGK